MTAAGRPVSPRIAVAEVVAASGHLLDDCQPQAAGVPVTGRIDPPSGDAPPMRARCSIAFEPRRGFSIAQVLVVTPPSLQGVRIEEPYERLAWLKQGQDAEAIAWEFVVTRDGPISVDSFEVDATKSANRMAPDWNWTGSDWQGPGDPAAVAGAAAVAARQAQWSSSSRSARPEQIREAPLSG
jgi:hypothetical protein